jgi:diadenylate cyclase
LRNIFYPKAPLHDGAVIIRERRVCAAGCFLPLTQDTDISRQMGTRHRAAIGMSEMSDAVVIVVSEETARISVAYNGKITNDYNYQSMREELLRILLPAALTKSAKDQKGAI